MHIIESMYKTDIDNKKISISLIAYSYIYKKQIDKKISLIHYFKGSRNRKNSCIS